MNVMLTCVVALSISSMSWGFLLKKLLLLWNEANNLIGRESNSSLSTVILIANMFSRISEEVVDLRRVTPQFEHAGQDFAMSIFQGNFVSSWVNV